MLIHVSMYNDTSNSNNKRYVCNNCVYMDIYFINVKNLLWVLV